MLKHVEETFQILAHLHGESTSSGWVASALSTYEKEHWTIILVPERIVEEVSLVVSAGISRCEVVKSLCEVSDSEVSNTKSHILLS